VDYDADGDIDIIAGSYTGEIWLFEMVGEELRQGVYLRDETGEVMNVGISVTPELHDFDRDGDLDMLVGTRSSGVFIFNNNGTSTKPRWSNSGSILLSSDGKKIEGSNAHLADWNGDGRKDLIVGSEWGEVKWHQNISLAGGLEFSVGRDLIARSQFEERTEEQGVVAPGSRTKVHVADWNADGQVDLLVGDVGWLSYQLPPLTEAEREEKRAYKPIYEQAEEEYQKVVDERNLYVGMSDGIPEDVLERYDQALDEYLEYASKWNGYKRERTNTHGWVWLYLRDKTVHSVSDISQEFSFYMDGRFAKQYLSGLGKDVRNWGSLAKLDLSNANLLVLTQGNYRIPYSEEAIANIDTFLASGGTVLLMMTPLSARHSIDYNASPGHVIGDKYGVRMGRYLNFEDASLWNIENENQQRQAMLAWRKVGKGNFLFGSRNLFGHKPDASDPINAEWITPMLLKLTASKYVNPKADLRGPWAEHEEQIGPLVLEYHDGTAPMASAIGEEYALIKPHLVDITGVQPSPGMIKRLLVLPTGGGGFSSGARIAIGAWWGNYPDQRYGMVELIGHEAGHSWVLPFAEPLWNEPIATWLGIQVARRLGALEELENPGNESVLSARANTTLSKQIAKARKLDPNMDSINPLAEDAPRDLVWGKSYFVFEELEKQFGPGAMAKYFQMKRATLQGDRQSYSMDDCVAIWSRALGENLFPWFQQLAFDVDISRTDIDINE